MEPAMSILEYLWLNRNAEWFKHHAECDCPFESKAQQFMGQIEFEWFEIVETDEGPVFAQIQMTVSEWNDTIGPGAQAAAAQRLIDYHMAQASALMTSAPTQ